MEAKKQNYFVSLMATLMLVLTSLVMAPQAKAAEVSISGAGASDATITDMDGKDVTGQELNKYVYYEASYKWSLPENTIVKEGDTATFTLPDNVQIRVADTTFDVTDEDGHVVGSFTIKKGSQTGVLTFNDYFSKNNVKDIRGTLALKVSGTKENDPSDWFLNKSGWLDSQKKPNWTVVYNPQCKELTNVEIMDTLRNGQTYDVDSIQLWYGHVENNQFVAEEKITDPVKKGLVYISANKDIMTVNFDKLDKAVQLVYQTNANTSAESFTLTNVVDATSDQLGMATMTSTIEVGGDAVADGTQDTTDDNTCTKPQRPHRPCKPHYPQCKPQRPHRPSHSVCHPGCSKHHHHQFYNGVAM